MRAFGLGVYLKTLCATIIFATASSCFGQTNWTVISIIGDPDPVSTIDLFSPMGSELQIGNVSTNFTRGMDYFAPDSFYYYASTDDLNAPGERGLWSWVNGVNTQLATVNFNDTSGGDAAWDAATSRFYVLVNDGDNEEGDSLYVWENIDTSPTFTEIGETGILAFNALAVSPTSGVLYAYDSASEALYTINKDDASTEFIGASGFSLSNVGGMDFSADGETLALVADTSVFTVNTATGILTLQGAVSINCSAIACNDIMVEVLKGDVNGDGVVDLLDVGPFVDALTDGTFIPEADANCDGVVDLLDVGPFVDLLTG